MNRILIVAGTWDNNWGKPSKYMQGLEESICDNMTSVDEIIVHNGGHYNDLEKILNSCIDFDVVMWFANVPNDLPKVREVKDINPKAILINSKRNDNARYDFQVLIARALKQKANLTLEFRKNDNKFIEARIFDPLGTVWSDFTENMNQTAYDLMKRLKFLQLIKRESLICSGSAVDVPDYIPDELFAKYKEFGNTFHDLIHPAKETTRFLGNMSFRCERGFPSFRDNGVIFVSERNVDKKFIDRSNFVAVEYVGDKTYYYGDKKPSVDTPVQVRLYKELGYVNYILHAHVYVKDAPFTNVAIPCGGLQEVDEILKVMYKYDFPTNFCVNLIGHGCLIFAEDYHYFDEVEFVGRPIPEIL